jgi:anti-anti-sigma regulatory factor
MLDRTDMGPVTILAPGHARDAREIAEAARAALAAGARTLVLDLACAPVLRGDDIERLLEARVACEQAGAAIALAAVSRDVRHALEVLELSALFPYVYETRAAALEVLRRAEIAPAGEAPLEIGFDDDAPAPPPPPLEPPPA